MNLDIAVTMGLPVAADISSEGDGAVKAGQAMLASAVVAARDIGGSKLGCILYFAHTRYNRTPTDRGCKNSVNGIAKIAKAANINLVLEVVNRF